MKKTILFLTDVTLHIRGQKPTCSFRKAAERGRFYTNADFTPIVMNNQPASSNASSNNLTKSTDINTYDVCEGITKSADGKYTLSQIIPDEIVRGMKKGEIEIMVPVEGLPLIAGKDLLEYMKKIEKVKLNQSMHRGGIWRSRQAGV